MKDKNSSAAPKQRETVTIPKGGRPKSEARDVAVFLARWWRMKVIGELAKVADEWVIEHWTSRNGKGLTEDAAVRRSIRKAKAAMESNRYKVIHPEGLPLVCAIKNPVMNGVPVWTWYEGQLEAQAVAVADVQAKPDEGTPLFTVSIKVPVHSGENAPDWLRAGRLKGDFIWYE